MSYRINQLYTMVRQSPEQIECHYIETYNPTGKKFHRSVFCNSLEDFQLCLEEWNRNNQSVLKHKGPIRTFIHDPKKNKGK